MAEAPNSSPFFPASHSVVLSISGLSNSVPWEKIFCRTAHLHIQIQLVGLLYMNTSGGGGGGSGLVVMVMEGGGGVLVVNEVTLPVSGAVTLNLIL